MKKGIALKDLSVKYKLDASLWFVGKRWSYVKINLINIIKVLCSKLKWTEDLEEQIENETDHTGDSSINDHKNKVDVQNVTICKFYKSDKY